MNNIKKSATWLVTEAVVYYAIFITHQLVLVNKAGADLYGVTGSIFSYIYLVLALTIFGFETLCAKSWQKYSQKIDNGVPREIIGICYGQILFVFFALIILYLLFNKILLLFAYGADLVNQVKLFRVAIVTAVFSEGIRKMFRNITLLNNQAFRAAIIELISLILYMTFVWGAYFLGNRFTVKLIIYPFVLISIASCFSYGYFILNKNNFISKPNLGDLSIRLQGFIAVQTRGLISGNMLPAAIAVTFGFAASSSIKIVSLVINGIFSLAERFSYLILGRLRQGQSLSNLAKYTNKILFTIWVVGILVFIAYYNFFPSQSKHIIPWLTVFSYILLTTVELFAYPYEKIALANGHELQVTSLFLFSAFSLFAILKIGFQPKFAVLTYSLCRSLILVFFVLYARHATKKIK